MARDEPQNLFGDLWRETADSWRATPMPAKISFVSGFIGFIAFAGFEWNALPPAVLSSVRVACLVALLAGAVVNARSLDEFYRSVHLHAAASALIITCVLLYALSEFGANVGSRTISVFVAVWGLSFDTAFAALRRG
jgi:hypothetical protein